MCNVAADSAAGSSTLFVGCRASDGARRTHKDSGVSWRRVTPASSEPAISRPAARTRWSPEVPTTREINERTAAARSPSTTATGSRASTLNRPADVEDARRYWRQDGGRLDRPKWSSFSTSTPTGGSTTARRDLSTAFRRPVVPFHSVLFCWNRYRELN